MNDPDAGAKLLANWIGYAWDGLQEGRIGDKGYPQWAWDGAGHKGFQGGKQDLRDLAANIRSVYQETSDPNPNHVVLRMEAIVDLNDVKWTAHEAVEELKDEVIFAAKRIAKVTGVIEVPLMTTKIINIT